MSVLQPDPGSGQPTASDLPAFQVVLQGCNPAQVDAYPRSSSPAWRTLSRHGPRSRRIGPAERAMFHAINRLPEWLYRPMLVAQYLGVLAMLLVVAAGALAWRRCRLAAALVLVVPLKLAAERGPQAAGAAGTSGNHRAGRDPSWSAPGGLSLVSGHAIITFTIAGLLVLMLPRRWGSSRSCWRPSTRATV